MPKIKMAKLRDGDVLRFHFQSWTLSAIRPNEQNNDLCLWLRTFRFIRSRHDFRTLADFIADQNGLYASSLSGKNVIKYSDDIFSNVQLYKKQPY